VPTEAGRALGALAVLLLALAFPLALAGVPNLAARALGEQVLVGLLELADLSLGGGLAGDLAEVQVD
jgi:hypothetical protein